MKSPAFDPVTVKEIYGISRRGQTYLGRVLYVGLIGLIMYQFWSSRIASNPFLSPSAYAELGRELFKQFVPLQMIMVTLASIGAAADRIVKEERSGTLGLLLLTPLTAKRIALSKWTAAMAQASSLILCGIPVVAICVYLGSVGPWDLLWCFSLTGALAMLGAAFGLRASAVCSSVPRALSLGFLYFLGYGLSPLGLLFVAGAAAFFASPFLHPVYSAGWILFGEAAKDNVFNYSWIAATIVSFFVARFIAGSAGALIEKRVRSPKTAAPADPGPAPEIVRTLRGKPVRLTREVYDADPLLWKELITRGGSRWSAETKSMFLVYAIIFIALCWLFTRGNSLGTFAFLGALFSMLALINGAALFAPEKEGRKMDMLLSSPVPSSAIVRSKLLSGLVSPESVRILLVALMTAAGFSWWSGAGVLLYMAVLLIFLVFMYTLSAAASLHAESLQGAALATAGIACILFLVLPIFASILAPSSRDGQVPVLLDLMAVLNPVFVLEPLREGGEGVGRSFGRFLLFSGAYLAVVSGLSGLMLWRFDRLMGRV